MKQRTNKWISSMLALTIVLSLAVATGQAQNQQPSAKVTAKTSRIVLLPETTGTGDWQTILANNIKTANQKDLFIGVSLEVGLFTQTLVRSKNNVRDTSVAEAVVQVRVLVDDRVAE